MLLHSFTLSTALSLEVLNQHVRLYFGMNSTTTQVTFNILMGRDNVINTFNIELFGRPELTVRIQACLESMCTKAGTDNMQIDARIK